MCRFYVYLIWISTLKHPWTQWLVNKPKKIVSFQRPDDYLFKIYIDSYKATTLNHRNIKFR